jgi:hypothetical protein
MIRSVVVSMTSSFATRVGILRIAQPGIYFLTTLSRLSGSKNSCGDAPNQTICEAIKAAMTSVENQATASLMISSVIMRQT